MNLNLDIIREDSGWDFLSDDKIKEIAEEVIKEFPKTSNSEVEIALLLTDDAHIRKLNKEFRGKNKPTNVLSFPDREINPEDLLEIPEQKEYIYIGDVACAFQTIKRESEEYGVELYDHFAHMLVHGILHLLGYDHEKSEKDEKEMILKEEKLLNKLSIKSPY